LEKELGEYAHRRSNNQKQFLSDEELVTILLYGTMEGHRTLCSSKKLHYYGVKLHVFASQKQNTIPFPYHIGVSNASMHDLTASRNAIKQLKDGILLCDKAYCDKKMQEDAKKRDLQIFTPIKKPKGGELTDEQILFSKTVSKYRQPIESLFNWINEKTGIQTASKVRSSKGLAVHIYSKIACAMLMKANISAPGGLFMRIA